MYGEERKGVSLPRERTASGETGEALTRRTETEKGENA